MANRFKKQFNNFNPTFYPERLSEPSKVKKPSKIFTVSMGDLFGEWVPYTWIAETLTVCKYNPRHTFIFLTKNPERYYETEFPDNCWVGATTTNKKQAREFSNELFGVIAGARFVSAEPLLEDIAEEIDYRELDWIIIGAMTGPGSKKHQPKIEWIENLISKARKNDIKIFMKPNLKDVWKDELIQEFPKNA